MTSITYTATLDVGRETAETLARLLREHRERLGTRKGIRALGVFKAGDSFVMKPGYVGVWKTIETVRKIYLTVS
ncbi:cupin domain-containing protein [Streptomyces variegatus]|uniref:cupin domain-containing protein n=1 Tax=Streptomyces variegatus TaxID=284040 RepID=UPI003C2DD946